MSIIQDTKEFVKRLAKQDVAFYAAAAYLVIEYIRPHMLIPALNILPWTPIILMTGLLAIIVRGGIRIQGTHLLTLALLGSVLISSHYSYDREESFRMVNVMLSWVVVTFIFTNSIRNLEQYKLSLIVFFICIFKMSLFGAKTWALRGFSFTSWGIAGPQGWFQNSGELALIMVVFAAMSFGYLISTKNANKLYYLAPITAAMTVIAASSRGSQLALAAIAIIAALTIGKLKPKNLILFFLLGWIIFSYLPEEQKVRFSTMGSDRTSESRLMYWEKGIEMMQEHKWVGIGYYAFPNYFAERYAPFIEFKKFVPSRKEVAHNSLVQVGSEMGYPGLIIYCWMILHCLLLSRRTRILAKENPTIATLSWIPTYTRCVDLAMAGYFIGSFFMSVAFYPYIYFLLMYNQTLFNASKYEKDQKNDFS